MKTLMRSLLAVVLFSFALMAQVPVAQRIVHYDAAKNRPSKAVHEGPGQLDYQVLFGNTALDTNLIFLHRGIIEPKSGIGHHFHNQCEEMFFILDGEAQFTVDGRTSLMKGPAGAPSRAGHSHAIYNATDKPVEWMNINVGLVRGKYDAFNLSDGRANVPLDNPPVFMTTRLYRDLLRPVANKNGGKGTVQYRRALPVGVMLGPWAYMDHILIPPGASVGAHRHSEVAEFYYVMAGQGTVSIGAGGGRGGVKMDSAPIVKWDAIPVQLNEAHSFENTGTEPLELMVVGISRELSPSGTQVVDEVDVAAPRP
jgi:mannose-6-phosphate isomerase-like protein (cupin superfamily)